MCGGRAGPLATFLTFAFQTFHLFYALRLSGWRTVVKDSSLIPVERIEKAIYLIRGEKVMLDADLASLYGVETKAVNRAAKRNLKRFPSDFMFQLTAEESAALRYQIGTSKQGRGGRRYPPYAFTEQGVAMLSSVLSSERAVLVNIEIMRAFVKLRRMLASNAELSRRLDNLESKYDRKFKVVFDAIRQLMSPPPTSRKQIGFRLRSVKK
jgi:phage regulator Rha-like protein